MILQLIEKERSLVVGGGLSTCPAYFTIECYGQYHCLAPSFKTLAASSGMVSVGDTKTNSIWHIMVSGYNYTIKSGIKVGTELVFTCFNDLISFQDCGVKLYN